MPSHSIISPVAKVFLNYTGARYVDQNTILGALKGMSGLFHLISVFIPILIKAAGILCNSTVYYKVFRKDGDSSASVSIRLHI